MIYLDGNGHETEWSITEKATTTGAIQAATGLSLRARLSATPGGGAINASLDIALTERSALTGTYYGRFAGADLETHLAAYEDGTVWEVLYDDVTGEVEANHAQGVRTRKL